MKKRKRLNKKEMKIKEKKKKPKARKKSKTEESAKPETKKKTKLIDRKKKIELDKSRLRKLRRFKLLKKDGKEKAEKKKKPKKKERPKGKTLQSYKLDVDKASVEVRIEKTPEGVVYMIHVPEIETGTKALLEEIRQELITITTIGVGELIDEKSIKQMKQQFITQAGNLLKQKIPDIKKETQDFLVGMLMQDMLGLGKVEFLINDPHLEEIVITSSKEVIRVYHKEYGWLQTNIKVATEEEINNYSNIIARRVGRQINVLNPLLDAHIVTGDRSNAVLYPISTKGNTITIRKFARDPWTIIDLIDNNTCNLDIAALLWLAIEYEMNILISGGTASGKTVFLNSLTPFIPPNHRIISIEDTRELMLPKFLYWCPLVTRTPNPEGKGAVTMLDLLVNSLRMRPDRIILGEMRRQREAEVLFEAMHTGHSVYATVHADTAAETISRLINPPINVPPNLLKGVNLNVVMFRNRSKGIRRVYQVAEFVESEGGADVNILYRWIPEKDSIEEHNVSVRFFEDLSRNTGMSANEINKNLQMKKRILQWMIKNKIRAVNHVGKIMQIYYINREELFRIMKKNDIKEIIRGPAI